MDKKRVLGALIDAKKSAILRVLLAAKEELYLKEISERSGVALTSTLRVLRELIALDIIERREWKNSKVYQLKRAGGIDFLRELFAEEFDALADFVKQVRSLDGVEQIIGYGARSKEKANVLVIGRGVDEQAVEAASSLCMRRGFDVNFLLLSREQYEQMSRMGLYNDEKQVLG